MSIESTMPPNHLILCCPLLLLPSIFPSMRVISNESALCIRKPKYWSFSISTSNEYSGLISFIISWFDLLAVQGTLKSLLQHHSIKVSILRLSASFMDQLSHPYMTTGKTMASTIRTFVSKVMSLLFNILSRFVIAFLPRSKCPFICHEVMELDAMTSVFCINMKQLSCFNVNFQARFFTLLSPSSRGSVVPLHLLPLGWYRLHIWGCWYFSCRSWFQLMIHVFCMMYSAYKLNQ